MGSNQDNDNDDGDDSHSKSERCEKRRSQKKCLLHMGEICPRVFFRAPMLCACCFAPANSPHQPPLKTSTGVLSYK